jgi:sulfopyruvate decarboxylase alpha subunit
MDPTVDENARWPHAIFAQLKRVGVRQIGYVPDAGHSRLIQLCKDDPLIADVVLTTEEEGVALAAGAALGGERAALLMQSSGVGNCINMFSLVKNCGFPCLVLVTMRGEYEEFNPWQVPMGSITEDCFKLCGITTYRVEAPKDVALVVGKACDEAFGSDRGIAVILSQRLIGAKDWSK